MILTVKVDLTEFDKKLQNCFEKFSNVIYDGFNSQLTDEVRSYPRDTVRKYGRGKTGMYAGKVRDVVDSGELVDSSSVSVSNLKAEYSFTAKHAIVVYMGWVSKSGKEIPPYPWIELFLKQISIVQLFKDVWLTC